MREGFEWIARVPAGFRTRFAPSPTGYLHLGHIVNALYCRGIADVRGGLVLGRLEDHDQERCRPEFEDAIAEDLAWLGLTPDTNWTRQSDDWSRYAGALERLAGRARVYACDCSRKTILARAAMSGTTLAGGETPYDGFCRDRALAWEPGHALRLAWQDENPELFEDLRLGPGEQTPAHQGDLLLRDRKGNWTYQFAVTVDDFEENVSLVIRGNDLLSSTGRQLRLARLLGRTAPPIFIHHDLVRDAAGRKLSKRDNSRGVRELRRRGRSPEQVLGLAAWAAGLQARSKPLSAEEIKYLFLQGPHEK